MSREQEPPYTHEIHAARCAEAARKCTRLVTFVQVKTLGVVNCARLLDCWTTADGVDLHKVLLMHPLAGIASVRVRSVRQCSGLDGGCMCANEVTEAATKTIAKNAAMNLGVGA